MFNAAALGVLSSTHIGFLPKPDMSGPPHPQWRDGGSTNRGPHGLLVGHTDPVPSNGVCPHQGLGVEGQSPSRLCPRDDFAMRRSEAMSHGQLEVDSTLKQRPGDVVHFAPYFSISIATG